ncbi:MAG: DUF3536 domain-containing protein [Candidatus Moduliflexus flocculans]|nr:DUF3536 domain-containing protein [Candidatus Moduliflexus flocculans]
MPLATSRDKRTQVLWGIRDFESRFGRRPEGMWLPEAAVDLESLDVMAAEGILFTVLAPRQASATRPSRAGSGWTRARAGSIRESPTSAGCLRAGRSPSSSTTARSPTISLSATSSGTASDSRCGSSPDSRAEAGRPELVHIATDGETYGHHHRFGEMALAYALRYIEKNGLAEITVYGDYLERFPPADEVRIVEDSSWSCCHGIERWKSDCACSSGAHAGWSQAWRTPLREAMDWLGDKAAAVFESGLGAYAPDPWAVRDDYIRVVLDRSPESVEAFFVRNIGRRLAEEDKIDGPQAPRARAARDAHLHERRLVLRRHLQRRDRPGHPVRRPGPAARPRGRRRRSRTRIRRDARSGAEQRAPVQERRRGLREARQAGDRRLSPPRRPFRGVLALRDRSRGRQNRALHGGRGRLRKERSRAAEAGPGQSEADIHGHVAGADRRLRRSPPRRSEHHGGRPGPRRRSLLPGHVPGDRRGLRQGRHGRGRAPDRPGVRGGSYTLWHLFTEEKRKILFKILEGNLRGIEADFRQIFETNYPIMQAMREMLIPPPEALSAPAQFVLNTDFRRLMESPDLDPGRLRKLAKEYETWDFVPDGGALGYIVSNRVAALVADWAGKPDDVAALEKIEDVLSVLKRLGIGFDLWRSQNIYFSTGKTLFGRGRSKQSGGPGASEAWTRSFKAVGELLRVDPSVFLTSKPE